MTYSCRSLRHRRLDPSPATAPRRRPPAAVRASLAVLCVALGWLTLLAPAALAAGPPTDLRFTPVLSGFDLEISGEWPDGCLPILDHFEAEFDAPARVYLVSPVGECADSGPLDWSVELRLSAVVHDPFEGVRQRVTVLWRQAGDDAWQILAAGSTGLQGIGCLPTEGFCGAGGRFQVEALHRPTAQSPRHAGAIQLTADSGAFWFFHRDNPELIVKVLDACATFDRYWVFVSGLTDVETWIRVTDRITGEVWEHHNPPGTGFESIRDTDAFATCDAAGQPSWVADRLPDEEVAEASPGPEGTILISLGNRWRDSCTPWVESIEVEGDLVDVLMTDPSYYGSGCASAVTDWTFEARLGGLPPGDYKVRVRHSDYVFLDQVVSLDWDRHDPVCSRPEVACALEQRFAIRAWYDLGEGEQPAMALPLTRRGAGFWFFRPGNLELMVKVLDGCPDFDRFWVFTSGLTDVGVRLEVEDRWTGERWETVTTRGEGFPAIRDTSAFDTCDAPDPAQSATIRFTR